MKVARNTTHNLRHDWLKLSDERGAIEISLSTHRNEIMVSVSVDGKESEGWVSARRLAELLLELRP